jgi:tetraacyldisaccharide 4'-kinase
MSAWLQPFGTLFGSLAALRATLYRRGLLAQARLEGSVISVGNLSVGGTGKTPIVARVAELLRDAGLKVAVLSRGYRGRFRGDALLVSDGERLLCDAAAGGDEPVMLAQALSGVVVAVGRRRDRVGRFVEERFGPCTHVLDDGFQHLRLARDLDLLCIDPRDPDGRPLPAGRMREFLSASKRADLVLLTQADRAPVEVLEALEARFGHERTLRVRNRIDGFFDLEDRPTQPPTRPYLLAAIAGPERFEQDVRARVSEVVGLEWSADHHPWRSDEIAAAAARARARGADALVTTAKDAVRLPREIAADDALPIRILKIAAEIEDEPRLRERLLAVARRAA